MRSRDVVHTADIRSAKSFYDTDTDTDTESVRRSTLGRGSMPLADLLAQAGAVQDKVVRQ